MTRAYHRGSVVDRLWQRVDRSGGPDACWPFIGARFVRGGYGAIRSAVGGVLKAHRVTYEAEHGPIPEGMGVLHRCDNPPCCNPAHLFAGTIAENNRDMWAKGRGKTGHEKRTRDALGRFA